MKGSKLRWTFAHTEDGLAVARVGDLVCRVFHNGSEHDWEVMTAAAYLVALNTGGAPTLASGREEKYSDALAACQDAIDSL